MQTQNTPCNTNASASTVGYMDTRSESMEGVEMGSFLTYFINLDERGEFMADVRNANQDSVFEIDGFEIFEDGFMRSKRDLVGLKEHLVDLGIMTKTQDLIMG